MKQLFVIITLFSYLMGSSYSNGCKLYNTAKKELRHGNIDNANILFLKAKKEFVVAQKKHSSQAILKLAEMYCNGWGVAQNTEKSKDLLQQAITFGANKEFLPKCLKNLK